MIVIKFKSPIPTPETDRGNRVVGPRPSVDLNLPLSIPTWIQPCTGGSQPGTVVYTRIPPGTAVPVRVDLLNFKILVPAVRHQYRRLVLRYSCTVECSSAVPDAVVADFDRLY
eukprot:SAG31_NODE_11442_length_1030_cov_0.616541_2_plen_113_part_00